MKERLRSQQHPRFLVKMQVPRKTSIAPKMCVPVKLLHYDGAPGAPGAIFPMLYYDNGDGVYEFPGADGPVTVASKVLVGKVTRQ